MFLLKTKSHPSFGSNRCGGPNVGGVIIHLALHITTTNGSFLTRAYVDNELRTYLRRITTIIIEEVSIVSAEFSPFLKTNS
jgi:hypothetical protein